MKQFISNCLQKQGLYVLPATFIMFIENYCDKQIKHSKTMQRSLSRTTTWTMPYGGSLTQGVTRCGRGEIQRTPFGALCTPHVQHWVPTAVGK